MNDSLRSLAERLDVISEEIAQSALTELKLAVRNGAQQRPATERALTEARRAIDKAAHLLRRLDADEPGGESDQAD